MSLRCDQSCTDQDREMRGHRVVRNCERLRQIAGSKAVRLVLCQQAKHIEPSRLCERRERKNSLFWFHMSRLVDK